MARTRSPTLTSAEQLVMEVLWQRGEASVRDVTEAISGETAPAYTTVLTVLRVLLGKGYVTRREEARAHVFVPAITRDDARAQGLRQFVAQFFGGSPQAFAQHLIGERDLEGADLVALEKRVARMMNEPGDD